MPENEQTGKQLLLQMKTYIHFTNIVLWSFSNVTYSLNHLQVPIFLQQ